MMRIYKIILCLICYLLCQIGYAKQSVSRLDNMTFSINYSGDISGVLDYIKRYDQSLMILRPVGKKLPLNVSLNMNGITLNDLAATLKEVSNNQVELIYNSNQNSILLNYTGVMDLADSAIKESLKWQNGLNPKPVLNKDGVVRFPYGEYEPVITCQPLNLCDLELQGGEDILGIVIGDSLRWNQGDNGIPVIYSGDGKNLTPHLVLKPVEAGLDTSLLVTTNRRTYMVKLRSSSSNYIVRAGFYYPKELVNSIESDKVKAKAKPEDDFIATNSDMVMPLIDLAHVNYKYKIIGEDYPWKPVQVFDDGKSVFIQMPNEIDSRNLPGVCVIIDGEERSGKCEMVNFRYNQHFYIIDKLFNQAQLITGFDNSMQKITISCNKIIFWFSFSFYFIRFNTIN